MCFVSTFLINSLPCTYSSHLKVIFLVTTSSKSPCCMKYIFFIDFISKTACGFAAPASGLCVCLESVCNTCNCELDVLWTASRDLCSFGGEEGSLLHPILLSCNSLKENLQPPCTSASHGSPGNDFDSNQNDAMILWHTCEPWEQGSSQKLLQDRIPGPVLVVAGGEEL